MRVWVRFETCFSIIKYPRRGHRTVCLLCLLGSPFTSFSFGAHLLSSPINEGGTKGVGDIRFKKKMFIFFNMGCI